MSFPVTEYIVFAYHQTIDRAHHAHFSSLDAAELFANDLRALSKFTVSEPVPVTLTESLKLADR